MKKLYYFWLDDQPQFDFGNPLSSQVANNADDAEKWAASLLWHHSSATWCKFKSETGRKEYTATREQYPNAFHLEK